MDVQLTPDQKALVRQAIEGGRLLREEDAVKEALSLWEERERTRAEILAAVDEAEASHARGEERIITQEFIRELAEEVKRRGRARLPGEQATPHHEEAMRIFDILGVTTRENSYTSLFCAAFNEKPEFRRQLLAQIAPEWGAAENSTWRARQQVGVSFSNKKLILDLVCFDEKQCRILVVENKLFASEGPGQEHYTKAKEEILCALELKSGWQEWCWKFAYLTLPGESSPTKCYICVSHGDLALKIEKPTTDSNLDRLLFEYRELIEDRDAWLKNGCQRRLCDVFSPSVLVREDERYVIVADCFSAAGDALKLIKGKGYEPPEEKKQNTGHGIEWFRRLENPLWPSGPEVNDRKYQACFCLLYRAKADRRYLSLRLDYNCGPKKEVKLITECNAIRNRFADALRQRKSDLEGWTLRNDWYFQASVNFDLDSSKLTLAEWRQEITGHLGRAAGVLDDILPNLPNQSRPIT
jgi:hypothetical protein